MYLIQCDCSFQVIWRQKIMGGVQGLYKLKTQSHNSYLPHNLSMHLPLSKSQILKGKLLDYHRLIYKDAADAKIVLIKQRSAILEKVKHKLNRQPSLNIFQCLLIFHSFFYVATTIWFFFLSYFRLPLYISF